MLVSRNLITGAKLLDHFFWSGVFRECLEEIFFAFKDRCGAGESRLRHQSGGETVSCRRSPEAQCFIGVFGVFASGIYAARLSSRRRQRVGSFLVVGLPQAA